MENLQEIKGSIVKVKKSIRLSGKIINRLITNPRKKALDDIDQILDSDFGVSRGTPLDRKLISDYLWKATRDLDRLNLTVLEFGDRIISENMLKKSISWIFLYSRNFKIDTENQIIFGDLTNFDEKYSEIFEKFDVILSTQLMAFTDNPFAVIKNLNKMLKKDGVLIGTEPFLSPVSKYDNEKWGDYFRFTLKGMGKLLDSAKFTIFEITALGNFSWSLALSKGLVQEDNLNLPISIDDGRYTNVGYIAIKANQ